MKKKYIVKTTLEEFGDIFITDKKAFESFEKVNEVFDDYVESMKVLYSKIEKTELFNSDLLYMFGDVINILAQLQFKDKRKYSF